MTKFFARTFPTSSFHLRTTGMLSITLFAGIFAGMSGVTQQSTPDTQPTAVRAIGRRLQEEGIPNFGEVTPSFYRGGLLNPTGIKALKRLGVKVITILTPTMRQKKKSSKAWG